MFRIPASLLLLLTVLSLVWPTGVRVALADSDQDRVRQAVQSGAVRPLGDILSVVRQTYPGRVLDAEIDRADTRWIYDIRLLGSGGQVTEVKVDADSAEILGVRRGERRSNLRPARHELRDSRDVPPDSSDVGRREGDRRGADPKSGRGGGPE
jgi:hypothetical protein